MPSGRGSAKPGNSELPPSHAADFDPVRPDPALSMVGADGGESGGFERMPA